MIEVFRTNVSNPEHAKILKEQLQQLFKCEASFDLDDCDRILRVKCFSTEMRAEHIIRLLKENGFAAEILPEDYPLPIIQSILNARLCW